MFEAQDAHHINIIDGGSAGIGPGQAESSFTRRPRRGGSTSSREPAGPRLARGGRGEGGPGHPPVPGLRVTRVEPTGGLWQISSSEVRERLARRESLAGLVPDKVIEYIREKGLYAGH